MRTSKPQPVAFAAGYVLKSCAEKQPVVDRFGANALCLIRQQGEYNCGFFNNNFDARIIENEFLYGLSDGIEIEDRSGALLEKKIPLTTGIGTYLDKESCSLFLTSSATSSRKFFYRIIPEGIVFSSDLRFLMDEKIEIDPVGGAQLIIYGAASGTSSPVLGIKTIPFGHYGKFKFENGQVIDQIEPMVKYDWETQEVNEDDQDSVLTRIKDELCSVLEKIGQHRVALFLSGGVDSSLLACLMREVGISNFEAFTFGFGQDDPEVKCSVELAKRIGISHHIIEFKPQDVFSAIEECPEGYSHPFGDYSTIPSYFLVKKAAEILPQGTYILDGTGGDGDFGFGAQFRTERNRYLWNIPNGFKFLASKLYNSFDLWQYQNVFAHAFARIGSGITPHPALMEFFQNPWANQVCPDGGSARRCHQEILDSAVSIFEQPYINDAQIVTALDYVHIVGNLSCGKIADPARNFGLAAEFPFLWPKIVRFGFSLPLKFKKIDDRVKFPLKKLLDNYVGRDYTDRKKSGFTPPLKKWLTERDFNSRFKQILLNRIYLRDHLLGINLEKMLEIALRKKKEFRNSVYNIIWLTLFTELWFAKAEEVKGCMQKVRRE